MKRLIRKIVIAMMKIWHENKTERRRRENEQTLQELRHAFFRDGGVNREYVRRVPARLQFCIPGQLRVWLEEKATCADPDLLIGIRNARACGIEISPNEVTSLMKLAASKSGIIRRAVFLKQLHGDPLPLETVLQLVREAKEGQPSFFDCRPNETTIEELLELIDNDNAEQTDAFVWALAEEGQFKLMVIACRLLDKVQTTELVRQCFDAHIGKSRVYFGDLAEMAILLDDCGAAQRLISMIGNRTGNGLQEIAGRLALFIFHSQENASVDDEDR